MGDVISEFGVGFFKFFMPINKFGYLVERYGEFVSRGVGGVSHPYAQGLDRWPRPLGGAQDRREGEGRVELRGVIGHRVLAAVVNVGRRHLVGEGRLVDQQSEVARLGVGRQQAAEYYLVAGAP